MSPDVLDLHPAHHLPGDDLDVLVVDVDALQAVDLLDLVHQVPLQLLLAPHAQDVVGVDGAVHERLAGLHPLPFLDVDVGAAGKLVLAGSIVVAGDEDLAVLLGDVAVLHHAVDLGDDRGLLRPARLEQLHHARQTARDVLGLGGLARDLGQHVARGDLVAVLDHEVGPEGSRYLRSILPFSSLISMRGCFFSSGDSMMTEGGHPGVLVHLLVEGLPLDDVLEGDLALVLGEDRERVGVPLHEELALLDLLAVLDLQLGAVDDGVALALAALLVLDDEGARAVHDHEVALLVLDRVDVVELQRARVLGLERRLLGWCGSRCRRCGTCAW